MPAVSILTLLAKGFCQPIYVSIHTRHYWRVKRFADNTLSINDFFLSLREPGNKIMHLAKKYHQTIKKQIKTKACELREPLSEVPITWGSRPSP